MTKIFKTMACAVALFGAYATANATVTPLTFGSQLTLGPWSDPCYSYTPSTNGVLELEFTEASGSPNVVFNNYSEDSGAMGMVSGEGSLPNLSFNLSKGITYYVANTSAGTRTFTASWTETAGGEEEKGNFTPMQTTEISLNQAVETSQTYNGFSWQTEGDISGPGTCLEFKAEQNGTLVITQNGSLETHLFKNAWNELKTFSSDDGSMILFPAPYPNGAQSSNCPLTYTLDEGSTYYFYAKVAATAYDGISSITYSWTPSGSSAEMPVAEIGKLFNCYDKVTKFTPNVSGIMSVLLSDFSNEIVNANNLLFTNASHTDKVSLVSGEEYDGNQYLVNYYVEAGTTYYFYQSASASIDCTILEIIEKEQSIIMITSDLLPQPGTAGWNDSEDGSELQNYASGFHYTFSPADVTIPSATVSYTNNDGENVSTTYYASNQGLEYMGNGWIVRLYDSLLDILKNGMPNTFFTVTLNNITYNGKQMPIEFSNVDAVLGYMVYDSTTGSVSVKYKIPGGKMTFNEELSTWPETIYDTWTPGDPAGLATLVFSNNIREPFTGEATVTLGSQTWGSVSGGDNAPPSANIPYTITNNVMTLDFTKVTIQNLNGYNAGGKCTVFVTGIYDVDGQEMPLPAVDKKLPYVATEAPKPEYTVMEAGNQLVPGYNPYLLAVDEFVIQWAGVALTATGTNNMQAVVYIDQVETGTAPISITEGEYTEVSDCLTIDMSSFEGKTGQYMVKIPQGIVSGPDNNLNPEQYLSCTVYPVNNDYTFSPIAGGKVEQGGQITLSFDGAVVINEKCDEGVVWANSRTQAFTIENSLVIPIYEEMELDTYTLTVPATYLIINNESLNPEIVAEFTVIIKTSGITGIDADANGLYNVYTLNGVKVATGNADVVKDLNKGLYIINGKKVLVK